MAIESKGWFIFWTYKMMDVALKRLGLLDNEWVIIMMRWIEKIDRISIVLDLRVKEGEWFERIQEIMEFLFLVLKIDLKLDWGK